MPLAPPPIPDSPQDHFAGLRYLTPLGPEVPGLDSTGLGFIRDDLLAYAAGSEQQAEEALAAGNVGLAQRCGGAATACRDAAAQIVRYALDPTWGVTA